MKRPIAEMLTLTVRAGTEGERLQCDRELWQILSRKQGYVTHRFYRRADASTTLLIYSEWESKKILDGARQQIQGTPLFRRAQATLTQPIARMVVELHGALMSTKGLDLPEGAVAVVSAGRASAADADLRKAEETLWKQLAAQPGYLTHVRFRGFDDPLRLGAMSHWTNDAACDAGLALAKHDGGLGGLLAEPLEHTRYVSVAL